MESQADKINELILRTGGVRLKLPVRGQAGGSILEVAGQEGGGSWKLANFHGSHVYRALEQRNIFLWLENKWTPKKIIDYDKSNNVM